jgi:short-subunit dehydrogenase
VTGASSGGVSVTVMTADLSAPGAPGDLAGKLAAAGVTVDLLVNNAGLASYGPFADEDPDRLAGEIQLNCGALVALTARLLPPMLAHGRGGVLNVASTAGFQPVPTMAAVYGASQAPAGPGRWSGANERLTWPANLRHAARENRSTGPAPSCLVSRTAIA